MLLPRAVRLLGYCCFAVLAVAAFTGCPRNQTTLDDRTIEKRPHVETDHPEERGDPFRP
ncbi:MAG: hypothetical protein KIS92_07705 [Planctomycetota bacterium]|nr:hypothetical protein [Planctomycetota bacterium]